MAAVKLEDTQATDEQQQVAEEADEDEVAIELVVEQQKEEEDDGLLLFPAHLSDSLRELSISECPELILVAPPLPLPDGHKSGIGGLQALRSLQRLSVGGCPKFLSEYKTSSFSSSSCCPFPSSLQELNLIGRMEGMETLEPLSNLSSLTRLDIRRFGEDFRCEGLSPLLTQGQLSELFVYGTPRFFAGLDPIPILGGLQDEQEQLLTLQLLMLGTDDFAGVLVKPICSLLSSSLTILVLADNKEVERFTKEQEEALQLLTSLQDLRFNLCDKLQRLPAGLHRLTSLRRLEIGACPAIRSLPKDGLPSSLQALDVSYCGNEELKQRCRKSGGTIPEINL